MLEFALHGPYQCEYPDGTGQRTRLKTATGPDLAIKVQLFGKGSFCKLNIQANQAILNMGGGRRQGSSKQNARQVLPGAKSQISKVA